jgi:hypothetical protein
MDIFTLKEVSQMRYREMLQEAEHERLCRRIKNNQAGQQRLLTKAGEVLIALGQWLKGQAQSHPARPTFHVR